MNKTDLMDTCVYPQNELEWRLAEDFYLAHGIMWGSRTVRHMYMKGARISVWGTAPYLYLMYGVVHQNSLEKRDISNIVFPNRFLLQLQELKDTECN